MTFWEHMEELRERLTIIVGNIFILFVYFFACGYNTFQVGGVTLAYPIPTLDRPIAAVFFKKIVLDLVPATVNGQQIEIYASLTGGIITLIYVSIFFAVVFSMPLIIYETWAFLAPGLYPHEKKLIHKMMGPAIALFILGCLFAYFILLPFIIEFLIGMIFSVGGNPLVTVDDLVAFILLFTLAFGIVFELPVIMAGITRLRVVEAQFWKEHWRWAFIAAIIFGGLITPDGSGITQLMVALPMGVLYFLGYLVSKQVEKRLNRGEIDKVAAE